MILPCDVGGAGKLDVMGNERVDGGSGDDEDGGVFKIWWSIGFDTTICPELGCMILGQVPEMWEDCNGDIFVDGLVSGNATIYVYLFIYSMPS